MSGLAVAGAVAYALVGVCAARFGYSLAAYSGMQRDYYNKEWVTSASPDFRPYLGVGYLVGLGFGVGWPLVLAVEGVRHARPWRMLGLLSWCATPAERRWHAARKQQQLEQAERDLGIGQ